MSQLNSPLDIYKILPKTNCRQCQVLTCLAFASAVIKGQKSLAHCPHLEKKIIDQFEGKIQQHTNLEQQQEQALAQLKKGIATVDFSSSAKKLGAEFAGGKLTVKCLSKNYTVDSEGNITSDCHIISWVTIPLLNYIISSGGRNLSGKWVPFRELKNGNRLNPLFEQRSEKPLKKIADSHIDLFENIIYILGGKPVADNPSADMSFILYPLPKVPILICYSKPEDNYESKLNLFFDTTAEDNLNIESIYMLVAGLVMMFEKITLRHG